MRLIIDYWRNCLVDGDKLNPDDRTIQEGLALTSEEIERGILENETVIRLQQAIADNQEFPGLRRILLCPWVYVLKPQHGIGKTGWPRFMIPVWIPALVNAAGQLQPDTRGLPFFSRGLLEPIYPSRVALGTLDSAERFQAQQNFSENPEWSDWFDYAKALFKAVTATESNKFDHPDYIRQETGIVLLQTRPSSIVSGLLDIYDYMLSNKNNRNAIIETITGKTTQRESSQTVKSWDGIYQHVGHMIGKKSLIKSQRVALHHHLTSPNAITPLNGPPGTGKTTVLIEQALQLWVSYAIEGMQLPPATLLTSLSNNAVLNILSNLDLHESQRGWLPITSLGLWCVSSPKLVQDQARKYQWLGVESRLMDHQDSAVVWQQESTIVNWLDIYIETASKEFNNRLSEMTIEQAVALVHEKLKSIHHKYDELLSQVAIAYESDKELQRFVNNHGITQDLESYRDQLDEKQKNRNALCQRLEIIQKEWLDYVRRTPFWHHLSVYLPGAKTRIRDRNYSFWEKLGLNLRGVNFADTDSVTRNLNRMFSDISRLTQNGDHELKQIDSLLTANKQARSILQELSRQGVWIPDVKNGVPDEAWDKEADTIYRTDLLTWAIRYWQGQYLVHMKNYLKQDNIDRYAVSKQKAKWRQLSCLTPFMLSTIHSAPTFFRGVQGEVVPLYNFFDTVGLDEAGQVTPELAIPVLALGRKCILAGDEEQIPPVYNLPERIDMGNALQFGLIDHIDEWSAFQCTGLSATGGSILTTLRSSSIQKLWLLENFRSVMEIMDFSNQLSYENRLTCAREDTSLPLMRAYQYLHVPSVAEQHRGSFINRLEIETIIEWIVNNNARIMTQYQGVKLGKLIGVVTPFLQQANLIRQALVERNLKHITVGTIHSFQGSERKIMIFSPVQAVWDNKAMPFFNASKNLLNVTVSRTCDSFIIIGNLNGWNPKGLRPNALLAQRLFARQDNLLEEARVNPRIEAGFSDDADCFEYREDLWTYIKAHSKPKSTIRIVSPIADIDLMVKDSFFDWADNHRKEGGRVLLIVNPTITLHLNRLTEICDQHGIDFQPKTSVMDNLVYYDKTWIESTYPLFCTKTVNPCTVYQGSDLGAKYQIKVNQWVV